MQLITYNILRYLLKHYEKRESYAKNFFIYSSLIVFLLFLPFTDASAKNDIKGKVDLSKVSLSLSTDEIDNLKSLGFTGEEINNMTLDEYNLNKNLRGEILNTETKYFKVISVDNSVVRQSTFSTIPDSQSSNTIEIKISEEEFKNATTNTLNDITPFSSVTKDTSYKSMTTSSVKLSNGKYRVKVAVDWKYRMPKNRLTDVIGVGINNALWEPVGGEYGKQNWTIFNKKTGKITNGSTIYNSTSNKWKYGYDMFAVKMNLKDDPSSSEIVTNINMYMYYTVVPAFSLPNTLNAYGEYAHQENHVEISPTISFTGDHSFTITNSTKWTYQYVNARLNTK